MKRSDRLDAGNVAIRGKTRLRAQGKAEPSPRMKEGIATALQAHKERPIAPGVAVVFDKESERWNLDAPHRDIEGWQVQICEAFATRSHAVMWSFLDQLAELVGDEWAVSNGQGYYQPDEQLLNFAVAVIQAEQPETPMQAALAAQMVAVHLMQMKASKAALHRSGIIDERTAAIAGKLARTFTMQVDAMRRAKGIFPTQTVNVIRETHIHYHHDKHAHLHGVGGGEDFRAQPHATNGNRSSSRTPEGNRNSDSDNRETRSLPSPDGAQALELEGSATLLSENAPGVVVPMRGREGKAAMQDARKRAGGGGAKG